MSIGQNTGEEKLRMRHDREEGNGRRKMKLKSKVVAKVMSYVLTATMLIGGLTLSPLATVEVKAGDPTTKNINLNVENSGVYSIAGLTQGQDKNGSQIYYASQGTPIAWHAMASASQAGKVTTSMTLLADDVVENPTKSDPQKAMIYDIYSYVWDTSELCTWLNNTDLTNGFLGNRFTTAEQSAINNYAGTGRKIAIPTKEEVQDTSNWFTTDENRKVASVTVVDKPSFWWLRSPGFNHSYAADVDSHGTVDSNGFGVNQQEGSARPAFHLNLSSVLFSSASGKSKSSSFAATSNSSTNSWNLTLQDGTGFTATRKADETGNFEAGTTMHVTITNVPSGSTYTQTSAMLLDGNNTVICYGQIKGSAPSANEDIEITIPSSVPAGTYTMKVFAENVRSKNIQNATDYASNMADIPVTVTAAPTPQPSPSKSDDSEKPSETQQNHSNQSENTNANTLTLGFSIGNTTGNTDGNSVGNFNIQCIIEKPGPICAAAFKAATPAGFAEAFTFSMLGKDNGTFKTGSSKKAGEFTLNIPPQYRKAGRTFALIGIDQYGHTKIFTDTDLSGDSITVMLDLEGYAFSVIYTDTGAAISSGNTTTGAGSGAYTIKAGDTLSAIARKLDVSVKYLMEKNNLKNPNKLKINQKIVY